MLTSFGSLSVILWFLFSLMSENVGVTMFLTPGQPVGFVTGAVHDHGGLFSGDARHRANFVLRDIQRAQGIPVVVETFESLQGGSIDDVARWRPRTLSDKGIYVLLAGRERDVAVRYFRSEADGAPSGAEQAAIREAFLGPLRFGDTDRALEQGIQAIGRTVAAASRPGRGPVATVTAVAVALLVFLSSRQWRGGRDVRRRKRITHATPVIALPADRRPVGRGSRSMVPTNSLWGRTPFLSRRSLHRVP